MRFKDVINISNFETAWSQIKERFHDDIIRGPFDHIDYELNLEDNLHRLIRKILNEKYTPASSTIVTGPKSKGMNRPLSFLEIEDLILLQSIVIAIAPILDDLLTKSVLSMRFDKRKKKFKRWIYNWLKIQETIKSLKKDYNALVVTDISTYFENIDHQLLRDLLLTHLKSKKIVDLIFLMHERWTHRPFYSPNPDRGLPQIEYDGSYFLSNIFLLPHDKKMDGIENTRYLRWIDDMDIAVRTEQKARLVLKRHCESLRDLYLSPNTGKTKILIGKEIDKHFFFEDNEFLTTFEKRIKKAKGDATKIKNLEKELISRYKDFLKKEKIGGNWHKILKRFYTSFKRIKSEFLVDSINEHLIKYPTLDDKICSYLRAVDYSDKILFTILKYLQSRENLYNSVQIRLLELLLDLRIPRKRMNELREFGNNILFRKKGFTQYGVHARSVSTLLIAKYGKVSDIKKIARNYDTFREEDIKLKKYIIAVPTLLGQADKNFKSLFKKARCEYSPDIQSLIRLIDFIISDSGKLPKFIKNKLTLKKIYSPDIEFLDIRIYILLNLLSYNEKYHPGMRRIVKKMMKNNSDKLMERKLRKLYDNIS